MLPNKTKKMTRKKEDKTIFLLYCKDKIAVRRRPEKVLLGGMWEFPNIDGHLTPAQANDMVDKWGVSAVSITPGVGKKHVFTHIEWHMTSYIAVCEHESADFVWVTQEQLMDELTLPSAFSAFTFRG